MSILRVPCRGGAGHDHCEEVDKRKKRADDVSVGIVVSGKRGTVKRWDAGTYEALTESPTNWTLRLHGARWRGMIALQQGREPLWDVRCVLLADVDPV